MLSLGRRDTCRTQWPASCLKQVECSRCAADQGVHRVLFTAQGSLGLILAIDQCALWIDVELMGTYYIDVWAHHRGC